MKWRCSWCGKPHEDNDPPCDNCGHHEFEKAVVPMAPEADAADATSHVWVCTECGNDHPKHTPPCDRCGNATLERRELTYDEDEVLDEMLGGESSGPSADVGYLDVLDAKLAAGFLAVGALVLVLALGFLGVVSVPGLDIGPAEEITAPGNDTQVGHISLQAVETEYVSQLNAQREANGYEPLSVDEDVTLAASNVNKQRVRAVFVGEETPTENDLHTQVADSCGSSVEARAFELPTGAMPGGSITGYDSEAAVGEALLDQRITNGPIQYQEAERNVIGVDVHVGPNDRVYVLQVVC